MRIRAPRHKTTRALGRTGAIVTLCTVMISAPAQGQVLIGMLFGGALASENFNIGFEIGMNLSNVDGLNGASVSRGTLLGLYASWRFSEHYHLYTAILPLSAKGAKDADPIALHREGPRRRSVRREQIVVGAQWRLPRGEAASSLPRRRARRRRHVRVPVSSCTIPPESWERWASPNPARRSIVIIRPGSGRYPIDRGR